MQHLKPAVPVLPITPTLLGTFLTCPMQYYAKYVTKEVTYTENEAAIRGRAIHKALEIAILDETAMAPDFAWLQPYANAIISLKHTPGIEVVVEGAGGVTSDLTPCTWWGDIVDAKGNKLAKASPWVRCKMDVRIVDHNNKINIVVDWKTGGMDKKTGEPRGDGHIQDSVSAVCASRLTGYATTVCKWVYVDHNKMLPATYTLTTLDPVSHLLAAAKQYGDACRSGNFPANPSGLCKAWCDVLSCQHNGKRG